MSAHRLRFAPSPTGYLHVGGARTALFNWLFVKHYGGQFLLRVEDTDRARSTEASTRAIFEGLEWLGLTWDEEVVYQGANLARHRDDAARLLESGAAYRCFCTPDEIDARRKEAEAAGNAFKYDRRCDRLPADEVARRVAAGVPHVLRFRVPEGETSWDDLVHGVITFPNKDIEDFVVLRSDATPIYNMAVVSDDIAMRITLVMRGDDHISNTPKQIMLYEALGAALPRFAHLPMIHGLDGKKLSKRHGATAVGDYRHMGILPQAMLNFLALLGWSPGNDIEVMTVPEMINLFAVEGLSKKAAIFDPKKLEWMNGQHLSLLTSEMLAPLVSDALVEAGAATREQLKKANTWLISLIELLKIRSRTIDDIVRQAIPYLSEHVTYDADAVAKQWKDRGATADLLSSVRNTLAAVNTWEPQQIEDALRSESEQRGIAAGKLFQPLRVALTGLTVSAGIFDVLVLLGRERSLARIDDAMNYLREGMTLGA
ncbi:MAG TPA: glutamate--tRNA ligase [Gemmatimonadaceae bacterium]|nr:glutamate--tRNA ligase [Gemmatimonadaceae bacterium]